MRTEARGEGRSRLPRLGSGSNGGTVKRWLQSVNRIWEVPASNVGTLSDESHIWR